MFWKTLFGGAEQSPEEQAKEQQEKNFDLLKYDGVKAARMGQLDYAVKCYREALKLQDDPEVHDYLAQALLRNSQFAEAFDELKLLSTQAPDNQGVLVQMAHVAYLMEDYALMEQACQQALALGDNSTVYYLLAQACLGKEQPAEAVGMLDKAIQLRDDYADAYLLRGRTLLQQDRLDEAAADAQWLADNVGDHDDVLMLSARIAAARGQADEALAVCTKILDEVNPFSADALHLRAQLRQAAGDASGAADDLARARELDPEQDTEDIEQQVQQAYKSVNPLGL